MKWIVILSLLTSIASANPYLVEASRVVDTNEFGEYTDNVILTITNCPTDLLLKCILLTQNESGQEISGELNKKAESNTNGIAKYRFGVSSQGGLHKATIISYYCQGYVGTNLVMRFPK